MSEACIVCEGFHDRAFWAGLLKHLGCTDPGLKPDGARKDVSDPWGVPVTKGHYAFLSTRGGFVRILPAGGKGEIIPAIRSQLKGLGTRPLRYLIAGFDLDTSARQTDADRAAPATEAILGAARELRLEADLDESGFIDIPATSTTVAVLYWHAPDPPAPGLPDRQTLERLICAAVVAVTPNRAQPVETWLDSRPDKPRPCPKEHAWSYLAGWYADCGGYEAFLKERIWTDKTVAEELVERLREIGVLRVAETIANWC